jgi:hypothetical protein
VGLFFDFEMFAGVEPNLRFDFIHQVKSFQASPKFCNHFLDLVNFDRRTLICFEVVSMLFF